jgi:hypothetical protein
MPTFSLPWCLVAPLKVPCPLEPASRYSTQSHGTAINCLCCQTVLESYPTESTSDLPLESEWFVWFYEADYA